MLHGEQISLRPMEREDIERLWEFAQDLDLGLLTGANARPASKVTIEHIYDEHWSGKDPNAIRWAIESHDMVIGGVELAPIDWRSRSAELAVWIGDKVSRQRGFGSDAMRLALNYAFKLLGLNRISYHIPVPNQAALQAYTKIGFKEEGRLRKAIFRDGQYHDLIVLGILAEDWEDDMPFRTGIV
ncbi:MAG: GNAT family N-acetyltransferase [Caldilineae bacterium]|nr:GNAT family N-acetyltransferase [Chloroflexota bacterium]MCB9177078.1 GNAT family N-acetyltransferase [Caldilineae bacterium]